MNIPKYGKKIKKRLQKLLVRYTCLSRFNKTESGIFYDGMEAGYQLALADMRKDYKKFILTQEVNLDPYGASRKCNHKRNMEGGCDKCGDPCF